MSDAPSADETSGATQGQSGDQEEKIMSDQRNGMDAGVPEDGAFDGDASGESVTAGVAPGGNEALPDD